MTIKNLQLLTVVDIIQEQLRKVCHLSERQLSNFRLQLFDVFRLKQSGAGFSFRYIFICIFASQLKKDLGIRETSDGSVTFFSEKYGQTYHSVHGARTESERVFIALGFDYAASLFHHLNILEVGFGTGLNAWLTLQRATESGREVHYTGIEAYPLLPEEYGMLPPELLPFHTFSWEEAHTISPGFSVVKNKVKLEDFRSTSLFNLVYFDAFSPDAQPELWSADLFAKVGNMMCAGGVITTYCSKSSVQRNLRSAGFTVEKHPGPPHKREVIRATKK